MHLFERNWQRVILVFLRGCNLPPPNGLPPIAPKHKTKWPGHLSNLFHILCCHFCEQNSGVVPTWGIVSRQGWRVRGGGKFATWKYCKSPFWKKYLYDMDLKLTEHVKNAISLLYKQNPGEIPIFGTFLAKRSILANFRSKSTFSGQPCFITSFWRHTSIDFHDLVSVERRHLTLYYNTK